MKKVISGILLSLSLSVAAQDRFADVKIETQPMAGSVHILTGAGGNIGVSAGDDGVLLIDDQYAPLAERINTAVSKLSDAPIRYIVNTHYHGDHVGSNAWFKDNHGSTVFAHDNVRIRLASEEDGNPSILPVVTYDKGIKFHFNGDTVHVMHLPSGHTDGDSIVWFEKANVLHTGDMFFNGLFPYIDLNGGGDVAGYIDGVETMLQMIDDTTKIIPGHGPAADMTDLQGFLHMLTETRDIVMKLKKEGKSAEDIIAQGLGEKWQSWDWRFITEERWINTLYR